MLQSFQAKRRRRRDARERKSLQKQAAITHSLHYQYLAVSSRESGVQPHPDIEVTVSLTTHSSRINDVHLTIETIFQQSLKPDRVVLWLSGEDFSPDTIPTVLKMQCDRGLEIEFCERDLGPYTKFVYALEKYPDSLLVTVDDDLMYPADMIDQLYRAHRQHPDMIHCHRAHVIRLDEQRQLLPYKSWDFNSRDSRPSLRVFPTGVGGVLYFPGCFDEEISNRDAFLRLSPKADDVWLKAMSLKKRTLCKKIDDPRDWAMRFIPILESQVVKLKSDNKNQNSGNDAKIQAVFNHYGLIDRLLDQC